MNKTLRKALQNNLKDLKDFQNHLFDQGHDFWHCDSMDEHKKMPFYYYQNNKSVNMSTCGICQKLMANRLKIRRIERKLEIELTPLKTKFNTENHVKRMFITNSSEWNPNSQYLS